MKLSGDLKKPWLIHAKGALFVVVGILSALILILQTPRVSTVVLLAVTIWAFCRFYYYLFYVLDRYLGKEKRFAGVFDAIRFLISGRSRIEGKRTIEPPDIIGKRRLHNERKTRKCDGD